MPVDIHWGIWAASALAAGFFGVALESFTGLLSGWRQRRHEIDIQHAQHAHVDADHEAEREHQAALQDQRLDHERRLLTLQRQQAALARREQRHHEVAEHVATELGECLTWIEYETGTTFGLDVDFYPSLSSTSDVITSPQDVATVLQGIAHTYPTKVVREDAARLRERLTAHYGEIGPDQDGNFTNMRDPTLEQMLLWQDELVP